MFIVLMTIYSASATSASSASNTETSTLNTETQTSDSTQSTPTPTDPVNTPTLDPGSVTQSLPTSSSSTSASSASASPSVVGAADTAPKGFLANKPLSISIIVVASVLGLIFLVIVGTWAVRKRRRSQLGEFADALSADNLVGGGGSSFGGGPSSTGHGSTNDVEKAVMGGRGWGVDVVDKLEAVGGAREAAGYGAAGMGMAAAGMSRGPSQTQRNMAATPAPYGQAAYASAGPRYNPPSQQQGIPRGPGPVRGMTQNAMYQPQQMIGQPYQMNTPYAQPYVGQAPYQQQQQQQQRTSPTEVSPAQSFPNLPNPFEGVEDSEPHFFDYAQTPVASQQFNINASRTAPARKPPPPYLTVNTVTSPLPAGPASAGSLNGAPMQPFPTGYPSDPTAPILESPQDTHPPVVPTATVRRSSLLDGNGPKTPTSASAGSTLRRHSKKASVDRRASVRSPTTGTLNVADLPEVLHPGPPPVAPPLPATFGPGTPTEEGPRVLKVVNV